MVSQIIKYPWFLQIIFIYHLGNLIFLVEYYEIEMFILIGEWYTYLILLNVSTLGQTWNF